MLTLFCSEVHVILTSGKNVRSEMFCSEAEYEEALIVERSIHSGDGPYCYRFNENSFFTNVFISSSTI